MKRKTLKVNIVHLLVNKRRIYRKARYTQFQERRLLMQSVELCNVFSRCDGTLWLYRPTLSSPGCVIWTDNGAPSALLTGDVGYCPYQARHVEPCSVSSTHLPSSHSKIRLSVDTHFHLFCEVDAIKKFLHQISVCILSLPGIIYMHSLSQTPVAVTNIC